MRKFYPIMLALVAVFAFGAVIASSASAEITLLAEWLANSLAIPAGTTLATEAKGSLLLEDTETIAGAASVLCPGIVIGKVGPNGEDETTEILNTAEEKIGVLGALALLCETEKLCAADTEASPIEVWPVGLPWLTRLFLMENGEILDLVTTDVANAAGLLAVGYELLCLVLGLNTEDTCVSDDFEIAIANDADTLDASILSGAETTPLAECSQSLNKLTGHNAADELTPILLANLELLTVSSE
jgi:hypothetical protein